MEDEFCDIVEELWRAIKAEGRYFKYPWVEGLIELAYGEEVLSRPKLRNCARL